MLIRSIWILLAGGLLSVRLLAQTPSIAANGVFNTASYAYSGLPNSAIAQGALFVVFGSNMGPATLQQAPSLPLATTLAGTSLSVTVNGTTVRPYIFYTSTGQVGALLPSNTPVGTGTITVSYNNATSAAQPIQVAANSVGIFAANQQGNGSGIITSASYVLAGFTTAANPGDTDIIWATGVGAAKGDEAMGTATVAPLAAPPVVYVGGVAATVTAYARSSSPGLDQIAFVVPNNVTGCQVPVAVRTGSVLSNFVTMAVAATGTRTCPNADGTGPTASQGAFATGAVSLISTLGPDTASGLFAKIQLLGPTVSRTVTFGPCTVTVFSPNDTFPSVSTTVLAAGTITVNGPNGLRTLMNPSTGFYTVVLGGGSQPPYLTPGKYTIAGGGGADVGAFSASLDIAAPPVWTNASSVNTIRRDQGQLVTWSGGGASQVEMIGSSLVRTPAGELGAQFTCTAKATDQQFMIPPVVLLALPDSGGSPQFAGNLAIDWSSSSIFTATGLDVGLATFGGLASLRNVTYQ